MTALLQQLLLGAPIGGLTAWPGRGSRRFSACSGSSTSPTGISSCWAATARSGSSRSSVSTRSPSLALVLPAALLAGAVLYWGLFASVVRFHDETRIKNSLLVSFGLALAIHALAVRLWTADERSITTSYGGEVDLAGRLPRCGSRDWVRCPDGVHVLLTGAGDTRSGPPGRTGRPPSSWDRRRTAICSPRHRDRAGRGSRQPGGVGYSVSPRSAWSGREGPHRRRPCRLGSMMGTSSAGSSSEWPRRRARPSSADRTARSWGSSSSWSSSWRDRKDCSASHEPRGASGRVAGGDGRTRARADAGAARRHRQRRLHHAAVDHTRPELEHRGGICRPGQPRSRGLLRHGRPGHPHALGRGSERDPGHAPGQPSRSSSAS